MLSSICFKRTQFEGSREWRQVTLTGVYYTIHFWHMFEKFLNKELGPGPVAQLVRVSSQYTKVVGLIPSQGTNKNQSMNA